MLAESVAQRVPEIGVRMALGASPPSVTRLVLRQGAWMIVIGLLLGVGGALAVGDLMASFVFNRSYSSKRAGRPQRIDELVVR